jgi:hypothetical protein
MLAQAQGAIAAGHPLGRAPVDHTGELEEEATDIRSAAGLGYAFHHVAEPIRPLGMVS